MIETSSQKTDAELYIYLLAELPLPTDARHVSVGHQRIHDTYPSDTDGWPDAYPLVILQIPIVYCIKCIK